METKLAVAMATGIRGQNEPYPRRFLTKGYHHTKYEGRLGFDPWPLFGHFV